MQHMNTLVAAASGCNSSCRPLLFTTLSSPLHGPSWLLIAANAPINHNHLPGETMLCRPYWQCLLTYGRHCTRRYATPYPNKETLSDSPTLKVHCMRHNHRLMQTNGSARRTGAELLCQCVLAPKGSWLHMATFPSPTQEPLSDQDSTNTQHHSCRHKRPPPSYYQPCYHLQNTSPHPSEAAAACCLPHRLWLL